MLWYRLNRYVNAKEIFQYLIIYGTKTYRCKMNIEFRMVRKYNVYLGV